MQIFELERENLVMTFNCVNNRAVKSRMHFEKASIVVPDDRQLEDYKLSESA